MLINLTIEQVTTHWKFISNTFPEHFPRTAILEDLMNLRMQAWVELLDDKVLAIILTRIIQDSMLKVKSLDVYYMYSFGVAEGGTAWREGIKTLFKYSAAKGCTQMTMTVTNEHLKNFLCKLGAESESLLTLKYDKFMKEANHG